MAPGLDAREATAALQAGSVERLQLGFSRQVEAEASEQARDRRDAQISLTPFVDCARRLGVDPSEVLGSIARTGPEWYRETFEAFVKRPDVTLAAFGWSLVTTPEGPAYRFAWPSAGQAGSARSPANR